MQLSSLCPFIPRTTALAVLPQNKSKKKSRQRYDYLRKLERVNLKYFKVPKGMKSFQMARPLDQCIVIMVKVFQEYAKKDGNKTSLSKKELKELIHNEMTIGPKLDDAELKGLMEDLDQNKDNEVSFSEFATFVGAVAMVLNEALQKH